MSRSFCTYVALFTILAVMLNGVVASYLVNANPSDESIFTTSKIYEQATPSLESDENLDTSLNNGINLGSHAANLILALSNTLPYTVISQIAFSPYYYTNQLILQILSSSIYHPPIA